MESSIKEPFLEDSSQEGNMARVLVTTTYSSDSIILALTKLQIERVFLLIDKKPDPTQKAAIDLINGTFGSVIEIKEKKVELYDILSVAKTVIDILDDISRKDEIYVNVTPGKKTQAFGVLLGCYARHDYVRKIFYVPEGTNDMITMPILTFDITDSQKEVLENIEKIDTPKALADEVETSRAMLYRNIKDLETRGYIEQKDGVGYRLTESGKIAKLARL